MSTEQPSRFTRFTNWFDPRCKEAGLRTLHYVVSLPFIFALILFGVGFAGGWFVHGVVYNRAYFASHYRYPGLKTPPPGVNAPIRDVRRVGLPAVVGINTARYPAVGDQGPIGACAAWASAWALSYEYRMAHPGSYIRFSPRYLYDHYSDTYAGGQDAGSWPDQDLELSGSSGTPRFKQLPEPPYQIDNPIPTTDANGASLVQDAAALKVPVQFHYISGFAQGAGQGAVDGIRSALYGTNGTDGSPVFIAFGVYPEYDNATQQPLIVSPTAGETSRGGHENVLLKCDDTKVFPDGTVGGCLTQNQWTKAWGANGRAWFSYDFIRRYSFGLEYITLGASAPHAGKPSQLRSNPKAHLYKPPSDPGIRVGTTSTTPWYVHGVHLYNRPSGEDISSIVNQVGTQMGVWPVAIAAVIGTESSFNPNAELWNGGQDNSCGLMQQIIANVYLKIGYVGPRNACNWEEVPLNSINYGTQMLRDANAYHGGRVPWPNQYVFYNAGMYVSDSFAMYPTGQAYANLVNNFEPWYRYSLAYFAGGSAPTPPKPKPVVACGKRTALRHVRDGHGGYWHANFWYCQSFAWPRFHWHKKTVVTWHKR